MAVDARERISKLAHANIDRLPRFSPGEAPSSALGTLSEENYSVHLFKFSAGHVSLQEKPTDAQSAFAVRAKSYLRFFRLVCEKHLGSSSFQMAMDLDDLCKNWQHIPVFSFQKRVDFTNALVPDVDLIASDFYQGDEWAMPDEITFGLKRTSAVFAGSTTGGGRITVNALQKNLVPRVAAARFFRGKSCVSFLLPNLVQCHDDAERMLKLEGFGSGSLSWREQFKHKFILSMDGNGATCSRVRQALASNCVLVKYDSEYELHYFPELQAYRHFIPVSRHEEVMSLIEEESDHPGLFEHIANESKIFSSEFLSEEAAIDYTGDLLHYYARKLYDHLGQD